MKKVILAAIMLLAVITINAQPQRTVNREGNVFSMSSTTSKGKEVKTSFSWKDSKGKLYSVYRSSRNSYFIFRVSKNTNKEYKYYLPKEVQNAMLKAEGLTKSK